MQASMNKVDSFDVLELRRNVMKKEMDILYFRELPSPKANRIQYTPIISYEYGDNIEEKEASTAKLVIDESEKTEPKLEPKEEDLYLHTEMSDEDLLVEQTISSVIFKHEESIVPTNNVQRKSRPEVEIKYEDDIEEYYESDECSESKNNISMPNDRSDSFDQNCLKDISHIIGRSCNTSIEEKSLHEELGNDNKCILNFEHESLNKSANSVLLPIVYATINVPFSQVSRFLAGYNLSPSQLSVIRKVRRQVKNRLYAQNCRKRRVAHIKNLANELQHLKGEKEKLCYLKDELKHKKRDMEIQFDKLYQHVMNVIAERRRNEELAWSDYESDNNNGDDEKFDFNYKDFTALKRKIAEKHSQLKIKKVKLETVCETIQEHIFRVLRSRSSGTGFVKNGIDQPLDLKLNNMNIANELAILNKYYTKNNPRKNKDVEGAVSIDGSRTSENEITDFDYKSSDSAGNSRNENTMSNDVTEYESTMDGNMTNHYEVAGESKNTSLKVKEKQELVDIRVIEETGDQISEGCYEDSGANDDKNEESDLDDDDMYLDEVLNIRELRLKKKSMQEQYEKLYEHVLEASTLKEPDFLKAFVDHCITLLKIPR